MNCQRLRQVLDAHVDGELDAATARQIDAHLASCADCAAARAARLELRERLRADAPRYVAPAGLRRSIARAADRVPSMWALPRLLPGWLQAGALSLATGIAGVALGLWIAGTPADDARTAVAVATHVASLAAPGRQTMIASSDRHAVKPWFAGKLDFAPPVRDLGAEGFALRGARLDHIDDRQAAAIVYRVRNHDLSLFVWRAAAEGQRDETVIGSVRGFGVATWAQDGLRFAAVSDVERGDLERFVALARETR